MRPIVVGCVGAILGLLTGIAIFSLGATLVAPPGAPTPTPAAARLPLAVTVRTSFLASQFQQMARQSGFGTDASLTFAAPDLARVTMPVQTNLIGVPLSARATVTMRLGVKEGRLVMTTQSVDMGGLAVPRVLVDSAVEQARAQAEEQFNRAVASALRGSNLRLSNIRITAEEVIVELGSQ